VKEPPPLGHRKKHVAVYETGQQAQVNFAASFKAIMASRVKLVRAGSKRGRATGA
jgi:hypothetical protein